MAATKAVKPAFVNILYGNQRIGIPVSAELKARFDDQFHRRARSQLQDKRMKTLLNLMRAAYEAGLKSGGAAKYVPAPAAPQGGPQAKIVQSNKLAGGHVIGNPAPAVGHVLGNPKK